MTRNSSNNLAVKIKGAEGEESGAFEVDSHFSLFLVDDNASYQELFWNEKNIVIAFFNLENTYNYIARGNLNRKSPK